MKQTFAKLTSLAIVVIIAAGALSTISSCSKTNPNAAFLGIYTGNYTTSVGSSPDTVTISAGSTSSSIVIIERVNSITLNATVTANSITIPSQSITIAGGSHTTSGAGSLTNGTLTINLTTSLTSGSFNSGFTGTKQ